MQQELVSLHPAPAFITIHPRTEEVPFGFRKIARRSTRKNRNQINDENQLQQHSKMKIYYSFIYIHIGMKIILKQCLFFLSVFVFWNHMSI